MVELGQKLRDLRTSRGLKQREVAKGIGVTTSVISAHENGIRLPSYEALIKLTGYFNVSSDYLLGISDNRSRDSQYLISLDGLSAKKMSLVSQIVDVLKE